MMAAFFAFFSSFFAVRFEPGPGVAKYTFQRSYDTGSSFASRNPLLKASASSRRL